MIYQFNQTAILTSLFTVHPLTPMKNAGFKQFKKNSHLIQRVGLNNKKLKYQTPSEMLNFHCVSNARARDVVLTSKDAEGGFM